MRNFCFDGSEATKSVENIVRKVHRPARIGDEEYEIGIRALAVLRRQRRNEGERTELSR
jgi:hypothetical protein